MQEQHPREDQQRDRQQDQRLLEEQPALEAPIAANLVCEGVGGDRYYASATFPVFSVLSHVISAPRAS